MCIVLLYNIQYGKYHCNFAVISGRSKVDHIQEIVTGNPTVIKMVLSFYRGARGQNALRQLLGPVVKEIIEDKNLGINTNPVDIYKAWVNQLETATGEARFIHAHSIHMHIFSSHIYYTHTLIYTFSHPFPLHLC